MTEECPRIGFRITTYDRYRYTTTEVLSVKTDLRFKILVEESAVEGNPKAICRC